MSLHCIVYGAATLHGLLYHMHCGWCYCQCCYYVYYSALDQADFQSFSIRRRITADLMDSYHNVMPTVLLTRRCAAFTGASIWGANIRIISRCNLNLPDYFHCWLLFLSSLRRRQLIWGGDFYAEIEFFVPCTSNCSYVEPAIDACKHYHSTAACVLYRGLLCLPLSSLCYVHRIAHIYHFLLICSPSSSDIHVLQPPWGGLFCCLFQTPICVSSPLFASTRVAVFRSASMWGCYIVRINQRYCYRSVSLQLGRAAPLIIQHCCPITT